MTRADQVESFLADITKNKNTRFFALCRAAAEVAGNSVWWTQFMALAQRYRDNQHPIAASKRGGVEWTLQRVGSLKWDSSRMVWMVLVPPHRSVRYIALRLMCYVLARTLDGREEALKAFTPKKPGRRKKRQSKNARRSDSYRAYHRKYQLERYHRLKCQTKTAPRS